MPMKRRKNAVETVHKCHFYDASTAKKQPQKVIVVVIVKTPLCLRVSVYI